MVKTVRQVKELTMTPKLIAKVRQTGKKVWKDVLVFVHYTNGESEARSFEWESEATEYACKKLRGEA